MLYFFIGKHVKHMYLYWRTFEKKKLMNLENFKNTSFSIILAVESCKVKYLYEELPSLLSSKMQLDRAFTIK